MTDIGTGTYTVLAQIAAETPRRAAGASARARSAIPSCRLGRRVQRPRSGRRRAGQRRCFRHEPAQGAVASWRRRRDVAGFDATVGDASSDGRDRHSESRRDPAGRLRRHARPHHLEQATARPTRTLRYGARQTLRRPLLRGGRRHRHRRDARAPHAGRVRRRPDPQRQDRPQPGDRRHDLGHGLGPHRGDRRRPALRLASSTRTWPSTWCRSRPTSCDRRGLSCWTRWTTRPTR